MLKIKRLLFLPVLLAIVACSSTDDEQDENPDSFDRGAVLKNWADNIIIPSFENFETATQDLAGKTLEFIEDPTEAKLAVLRSAYEEGYIQFQTVSMFEIGKAEAVNFRPNLNTYPVDEVTVEEKISAGEFNLELPSSFDEQGFPALDYLLYGLGETDAEIVEFYTSNDNSETYKDYLQNVSERINSLTITVLTDWKDSFRDDFVANTSSSNTGSLDRLTNDYILYYEKYLRSGKIGIPAGAFTGDPVPETVEAFYSPSLSKDLYLKALQTTQDFFNGKHFKNSQSGPSYKQYLDYLNTVKNGENLSGLINSQFESVKDQASDLDNNFVNQVESNNTVMLAAFDELQQNVVLMKVDMLQALSVSVDYVDSDGD